MRVAVVGAGLAGLSVAFRLMREHDVTVFEAESVAGGKARSERLDGYLFDWGPNGFLSNAKELRSLIADLGIENELTQAAPEAKRRYIYWGGKLHALPQSPPAALATALISPLGKMRALSEVLAKRNDVYGEGESVYSFFARHFGTEVAERVVAPALLGITAGDAKATSVDALFPSLRAMEREHGSILRASMRARGKERPVLMNFGGQGISRYTSAVAEHLGPRLQDTCAVERVERVDSGWRVAHARGSGAYDAVVVTAPAYAAAALLRNLDVQLSTLLAHVRFAPMRVAGIAFRRSDVAHPLDGFGFLAARNQGLRILGMLFTSSMFPQQAPPETAYLRVFLGGERDPEVMELEPARVQEIVARDLATALGISAAPVAFHEHSWAKAIPQYGLDHPMLMREIDKVLGAHPGLFLAGNSYRGLGVGDTVREACAVANRLQSAS